jgi:hypothetical protein
MNAKLSAVLALMVAGFFPALTMYDWTTRSPRFTEQGAVDLALHFTKYSPTFHFDGIPDSVRVEKVDTLRMPWTWAMTISFQCLHPGYGDRTGKILFQVVTSHFIVVTVREGMVVGAIINGHWDEIGQRELS